MDSCSARAHARLVARYVFQTQPFWLTIDITVVGVATCITPNHLSTFTPLHHTNKVTPVAILTQANLSSLTAIPRQRRNEPPLRSGLAIANHVRAETSLIYHLGLEPRYGIPEGISSTSRQVGWGRMNGGASIAVSYQPLVNLGTK